MRQWLIGAAGVAAVWMGGCQDQGGSAGPAAERQARPASSLMRDIDQDKPPDWREEGEPPQYESPPPQDER